MKGVTRYKQFQTAMETMKDCHPMGILIIKGYLFLFILNGGFFYFMIFIFYKVIFNSFSTFNLTRFSLHNLPDCKVLVKLDFQ